MLTVHSFLRGIYNFLKNVSKKSYRTCTIISTGTAVLCIISLNSNEFSGSGKNKVVRFEKASTNSSEDENDEEIDAKAKVQFDVAGLLITTQSLEDYFLQNRKMTGTQGLKNAVASMKQKKEEVEARYKVCIGNGAIPVRAEHESDVSAVSAQACDTGAQVEKESVLALPQPAIQLSEEERDVLLRIVEAEAGGEDMTGKILVANVILNRVNNDAFPDTVKGVVFQKSGGSVQFSPVADGRYYRVSVSEETREAVSRTLAGENPSQGALYFSARSDADPSNMSWFDRNLKWLFEYGGHEFYTLKD